MVSVSRVPNGGDEPCDGCGAVPPALTLIGARVGGGYDIGLRLCDDCRRELRDTLLVPEPENTAPAEG